MTFKVNPEKSIKKLPQILLNDEFENYAKTFGKNYNNIESLLASKSLNEFKSNQLTNSQVFITHPNTSTTNTNHNNTTTAGASTSIESNFLSNTMKAKFTREKSFYLDEMDLQSPLNHANVHVLELEVKNVSKDSGN
jgi:hypothetical protein